MPSRNAEGLVTVKAEVNTPPKTGDILELRIHGAGDTPLDDIIGEGEHILEYGDDETAGFYRRADVPNLEAYAWGKFTYRKKSRAFWVMLAPFTLANLSGWLVTHGMRSGHSGRAKSVMVVVRILALMLSVLSVVWVGSLFVDAVALQCGGQTICADNHIWLRMFNWEFFAEHPARRLVVGLLGPLLAAGLLVFLAGWRNADRYERYQNIDSPHRDTAPDELVKLRSVGSDDRADVRAELPQAYQDLDQQGKAPSHPLREGSLWRTFYPVRALTVLHAAAIVSGIAAAAGFGLWRIRRGEQGGGIWDFFGTWTPEHVFVVFALFVGVLVGRVVALNKIPDRSGRPPRYGLTAADRAEYERAEARWAAIRRLAGAAVVSLLAVVIWGLAAPFDDSVNDLASYTGFTFMGALLGTVALAAFAGLFVCLLVFRRTDVAYNGFGPLLTMVLGYLIVLTLTSGATQWMSDWLGDTSPEPTQASDVAAIATELGAMVDLCTETPAAEGCSSELARALVGEYQIAFDAIRQPPIQVPVGYDLIAVVTLFALLFTAMFFGWTHWQVARKVKVENCPPRGSHKDLIETALARSNREVRMWRKSIAADMRTSPRNTRMHRLAIPLIATATPVAIFYAFDLLFNGGDLAAKTDESLDESWPLLLVASRWVIVAALLGSAAFIRKAYSDPTSRRVLGGVWDVATFWPRSFQPFAPPAYSARAVPELRARVKHWLDQPSVDVDGNPVLDPTTDRPVKKNQILLSAHSQGVPITMAVITQLEPSELARVGFVSYGSPTGALYGTFFPEFYGPEATLHLANLLSDENGDVRWRNLWRMTDWTGGYAFPPPRRGLDYTAVRCDCDYPECVLTKREPGADPEVQRFTNGELIYSEIYEKIAEAEQKGFDDSAQTWRAILAKAEAVESLLCDPPTDPEVSPLRPLPPSIGHHTYLTDPEYGEETLLLRARLDKHQDGLTGATS